MRPRHTLVGMLAGLGCCTMLSNASAGLREEGDKAFRAGAYEEAVITWYGGAMHGDGEMMERIADVLMGPHAPAVRHGQYDAVQYLYRASIGGRQSAMGKLSGLLRTGSYGAGKNPDAAQCWAAHPKTMQEIRACVATSTFRDQRARVSCSEIARPGSTEKQPAGYAVNMAQFCLANKTPALMVPGPPPSAHTMRRVREYARHGIEWIITGDVLDENFERFRNDFNNTMVAAIEAQHGRGYLDKLDSQIEKSIGPDRQSWPGKATSRCVLVPIYWLNKNKGRHAVNALFKATRFTDRVSGRAHRPHVHRSWWRKADRRVVPLPFSFSRTTPGRFFRRRSIDEISLRSGSLFQFPPIQMNASRRSRVTFRPGRTIFATVIACNILCAMIPPASAGTGREAGANALRRGEYQNAATAWFIGAVMGDSEQQELLADLLLGPHAQSVRHGQYDGIHYLYSAAVGGRKTAMRKVAALIDTGSAGVKKVPDGARCWGRLPTSPEEIRACVQVTDFEHRSARVACSALALRESAANLSVSSGVEMAKLCLANKTPALLVPGGPPSKDDSRRVDAYAHYGIEWVITGDVTTENFERFREGFNKTITAAIDAERGPGYLAGVSKKIDTRIRTKF